MSDRLAQLLKLRDADADDPFVAYGIAMEHAKTGDHDKAIHWLDETINLDRQYCYAWYQKAKMLSAQGDDAAARQVLTEGMDIAREAGDDHARSEMAELLDTFS